MEGATLVAVRFGGMEEGSDRFSDYKRNQITFVIDAQDFFPKSQKINRAPEIGARLSTPPPDIPPIGFVRG